MVRGYLHRREGLSSLSGLGADDPEKDVSLLGLTDLGCLAETRRLLRVIAAGGIDHGLDVLERRV
jgi:hypothetical protein